MTRITERIEVHKDRISSRFYLVLRRLFRGRTMAMKATSDVYRLDAILALWHLYTPPERQYFLDLFKQRIDDDLMAQGLRASTDLAAAKIERNLEPYGLH